MCQLEFRSLVWLVDTNSESVFLCPLVFYFHAPIFMPKSALATEVVRERVIGQEWFGRKVGVQNH